MSTIKIIQRKIILDLQYFNENLEENMLNKLKILTKNECTQEHGYILNVIRLIKIVDNYISNANSDVVFIVQFEAEVLKPKENDIYTEKIHFFFKNGILLEILGKLKVIISNTSLEKIGYKQSEDGTKYIKEIVKGKGSKAVKTNKIISQSDKINIKIVSVKYEDKTFKAIAELVD